LTLAGDELSDMVKQLRAGIAFDSAEAAELVGGAMRKGRLALAHAGDSAWAGGAFSLNIWVLRESLADYEKQVGDGESTAQARVAILTASFGSAGATAEAFGAGLKLTTTVRAGSKAAAEGTGLFLAGETLVRVGGAISAVTGVVQGVAEF